MPTHAGRFNHMRTLLEAGLVARLELALPDADLDLVAVRSMRGGTLAAAIHDLGEATAAYDVIRLKRVVPSASFFKGDDADVSKITALKQVAELIRHSGSMIYGQAAAFVCAQRAAFFVELNEALAAEGHNKVFQAPVWNTHRAGLELLARVPLVRVPLHSMGPCGGAHDSLLVPIIPGISDADLLEHIELIKDLRAAHAAAARSGDDFDAAKFRLLIDAQPPCAVAALDRVAAICGTKAPIAASSSKYGLIAAGLGDFHSLTASMSTLPSTVSLRLAASGASCGCESRYSTMATCVRLRSSDMMRLFSVGVLARNFCKFV